MRIEGTMLRVIFLTILEVALSLGKALGQLTNHAEITPGVYFALWQAPSSGQRGGATEVAGTNFFRAHDMIAYEISGTRTQVVGRLPQDQSFVLELRDPKGNPMPKTRFGTDNSKTVDPKKQHPWELKVKLGGITPTSGLVRSAFRPEDVFVMSNKGVYTLEAQIRVWTQKTNGQFGVVLSQPVRVKVEKR